MENNGFWSIILAILPYLGTVLAAGWLTRLFTLREAKKKAQGDNRDQAIASLEKVIASLQKDKELKESENDELRADLKAERSARTAAENKYMAVSFGFCAHIGCIGRKPQPGQADAWYNAHKGEPGLGMDYLPINRIYLEAAGQESRARRKIKAEILETEGVKIEPDKKGNDGNNK